MISLRKLNSLMVIAVILLLLNHAVLALLSMYGLIDYSPDITTTGRRLFYPLVGHIIISLYLYFSDRFKQDKTYSKLIGETTQQIVTGIAIMIFACLHILSHMFVPAAGHDLQVRLVYFAIDIMLFISIALHLRVSIPRFLISFGLLEGKNSYGNFKRKMNVIILFVLIVFVLAEIIFYIGGVI